MFSKNSSKKILSVRTGFTVMEVIVASGIFIVMMLMVFGIFISVLDAQQETIAQSRLEREAQLVLETIAKKIRTSQVDYAEYEKILGVGIDIASPTSTLILIDQAESRVRFQLNTVNQAIDFEVDSSGANAVTSDEVQVTALDFYIEPTLDPFVAGLVPAYQPRVTVVMTLQSVEVDKQAQATFQQTLPQRGGGF